MGVSIVVMPVIVLVMLLTAQQMDTLGGIDGGGVLEHFVHECLQSGAGDDHHLRSLCCFDLTDAERIVMQAADAFRHQPGDRDAGAFAQPGGEFVYRQGGGRDLGLGLRGAAGQYENKPQKGGESFHKGSPGLEIYL